MDPNTRKKLIMERLSGGEAAHVTELAAICGQSEMTVRRDLTKLEDTGYLMVNRGVVRLNAGSTAEVSSSIKAHRCIAQKKRIAKAALPLVRPGSVVYLDCGTTVKELAMELGSVKDLIVYTNSFLACSVLSNFRNIELYILPGRFSSLSMGSCDSSTLSMLRTRQFDLAVLGAEAVHPEKGYMVPEDEDCICKQVVIANSRQTAVLADSSKLHMYSRCIYAEPGAVNTFITDSRFPKEAQSALSRQGVEVLAV